MTIGVFRSQIAQCYVTRNSPRYTAEDDYLIYVNEIRAIKNLVNARRKEYGSDISGFGKIFSMEREYFEKILQDFGRDFKEFSINLAHVIKTHTSEEASAQIVKMLDSNTFSLEAAQRVFVDIRAVFSSFAILYRTDLQFPQFPLRHHVYDHVHTAVKNLNVETKKQPKLLADSLCLPIPGVNQEKLPGITVDTPDISIMVDVVKEALKGICSEFRQRVSCLSKETPAKDDILLQNLNIRYKTILQRILSNSHAFDSRYLGLRFLIQYIPPESHGTFLVSYTPMSQEFHEYAADALDKST
ncbi:MAG TPA: hypothetical protein VLG44_03280 [Chlamydiales bacterium]|nr:hypothetical protein [Chlamydiales bacterium]